VFPPHRHAVIHLLAKLEKRPCFESSEVQAEEDRNVHSVSGDGWHRLPKRRRSSTHWTAEDVNGVIHGRDGAEKTGTERVASGMEEEDDDKDGVRVGE
jgi:hypothetical protein